MTIPYTLVAQEEGGSETLTIFHPDGPITVADDHPQFEEILAAARQGDAEEARRLADLSVTVAERFLPLTERVAVANGRVYFDGDEVHNALSKHIVRCLDEDSDDWIPLVRFMENLAANPESHSREQLYEWLDRRDFTITEDGCFIGYKGVKLIDGVPCSIRSGPAVVDGEPVNGNVPNAVGSIVTMPRSNVQHDPSIGCHSGLHVGSWEYAKSFALGAILRVKVNPRDVVSVPTDSNWAKVRTCRYEVQEIIDRPVPTAIAYSSVSGDVDPDDEGYSYDYYSDDYDTDY